MGQQWSFDSLSKPRKNNSAWYAIAFKPCDDHNREMTKYSRPMQYRIKNNHNIDNNPHFFDKSRQSDFKLRLYVYFRKLFSIVIDPFRRENLIHPMC